MAIQYPTTTLSGPGKAFAFFDLKDDGKLGEDLPYLRSVTHTPDEIIVRLMPYAEALRTEPMFRRMARQAESSCVIYPKEASTADIARAIAKSGFDYVAEITDSRGIESGARAADEAEALLNNSHTFYQQGRVARMAVAAATYTNHKSN